MPLLPPKGGRGNAQPSDVLEGKTFTNDQGEQVGTMPNNGAVVITPGTSNIAVPAGYHNGGGYVVGDPNLVAGNIKKGVQIFGITGTVAPMDFARASNTLRIAADALRETLSTTYVKVKEVRVGRVGMYRVSWVMRNVATAFGQIYKNGVPYGPEATASAETTITQDLWFEAGDLVQLYIKTSSASWYATIYNFRIYYDVVTDYTPSTDAVLLN